MPNLFERIGFIAEAWRLSKAPAGGVFSSGADSHAHGLLHGALQRIQPPRRGTLELMRAYKTMPWLRAVSGRISTSIASVPWKLYVVEGPGGKAIRQRSLQQADWRTRGKMLGRLKAAGKLRELDSHPLLDLLDKANPAMTGRSARQVTQLYLDLKGETFWILERNAFGMPVEYWPVPPHWIAETPSPGRPFFTANFQGWQGEIPESEVVWLKDPDPENPYGRGTGITEALTDELDTDEYASKHTKAWFYNRATPDLLIGVDPQAGQDEITRMKQKFYSDHKGFWNAFKAHFYTGKLEVHQLSQTFADQQLIPLRQFERDTVQQVFAIPPEIMGILEHSNRSTIDTADYIFSRWVLIPRLELLRSEMQERLVPEFDERLILEYESPLAEDHEFQLKVATVAPWSLSRNEWREMAGKDPDDETPDAYLVPFNLMARKVGEDPAGSPPAPAPAPSPAPAPVQPAPAQQPEPNPPETPPPEAPVKGARRKALGMDDIDALLALLSGEYLTAELEPIFGALALEWGTQTLLDLGYEGVFNLHNPLVSQFLLDQSETKIAGLVNETTRTQLMESLAEGVEAGESIPQLAKRVSDVFAEAKGPRATTIARTEVIGTANRAAWVGMVEAGVPLKQWLSSRDGRERETHGEPPGGMDGQTQRVMDNFVSPSGATGQHPGGFGVAKEDINCRCTTVAKIEESKGYDTDQLNAIWRQFDQGLIPWERKVESAAKRGFQKQQNAVMAALNAMRDRGGV